MKRGRRSSQHWRLNADGSLRIAITPLQRADLARAADTRDAASRSSAQLLDALQTGAAQLGASVPDGTFGYERIDVMGALGTLPGPTFTRLPDISIDASSTTTSAALPFTVSGIHFSVESTNSTLVPASVAAAGAPGLALSPSDCGSTTLACSLKVTAAPYQGGIATITVSAVDGAGRSAPATMHVTVSNPQTAPSPPAVVVAGSNGGGRGGGSLRLREIFAGTALALCRTLSRPSAVNFPGTQFPLRSSVPSRV
jgi:hypothetical protein